MNFEDTPINRVRTSRGLVAVAEQGSAATTLGKYASTAYLDAKAKQAQTEANAAARRDGK